MNKNKVMIALAIFMFVVLVGLIVAFYSLPAPERHVACTQEAKICPDGSAVGRSGDDCAFATCPTAENENASDK